MMGIVGTPYDLATTGIVTIIGTSYQCVLVIKGVPGNQCLLLISCWGSLVKFAC